MNKSRNRLLFTLLLLVGLGGGGYLAYELLLNPSPRGINSEDEIDVSELETASTFVAAEDGFGFRNFKGRFKEGDLTVEEVQAMFGDAVCTRLEGVRCIPHPKVVTWIDFMNTTMNEGGHCVGFTVVSNELHENQTAVSQLGASQTAELEREIPVLRSISQGYASSYASNVRSQEVRGTPKEILEAIIDLNEPVDIGIYHPKYPQNGHSLLGHGVVDRGDGIYYILVYDSNRPGEDHVIVVDTKRNAWFYPDGATNPSEATTVYKGNARTNSLTYIPLSAYSEPPTCPPNFADLCPAEPGAVSYSVVTVTGDGEALADTPNGQIGLENGEVVNTVPNGELVPVRGEIFSRQQPILLIPSAASFELRGGANVPDEPLKISVANPDFSVAIDGLVGQPGQVEQLTFDANMQEATFVAGGPQRPLIEFVHNQDGEVFLVQLLNLDFAPGQDLSVAVDAGGDVLLSSTGLATDNITVMTSRLTSGGEDVFAIRELEIVPNGTQALDLDGWGGRETMALLSDRDGDGTFEENTTVDNAPLPSVLETIDPPQALVETLHPVSHYLDDEQKKAVIDTLPTLDLTPAQLGDTILRLPALRPPDLGSLIRAKDMTLEEIADFFIAAGLDPNERTALLNDIGLTADQWDRFDRLIEEKRAILDALGEWEFRNEPTDNGLDDFLAERGVPLDEAADLMGLVKPPLRVANIPPRSNPTRTPQPPEPTRTPAPSEPTPSPAPAATETPVPTPAGPILTIANDSNAAVFVQSVFMEMGNVTNSFELAPGEEIQVETVEDEVWMLYGIEVQGVLLQYSASAESEQTLAFGSQVVTATFSNGRSQPIHIEIYDSTNAQVELLTLEPGASEDISIYPEFSWSAYDETYTALYGQGTFASDDLFFPITEPTPTTSTVFVPLTDSTNRVSLEIPFRWSTENEEDSNEEQITLLASSDLEAFDPSFSAPGIGVIVEWEAGASPEERVDELEPPDGCELEELEPFRQGIHSGVIVTWTGCSDASTFLVAVIGEPADRSYQFLLVGNLISETDILDFEYVRQTLTVSP